jgi:uncharacterized protein (PEP-CTERM system associated)
VTGGVSGKILSKLRGSVRTGYQIRQEGDSGKSFGSTTASATLTWAVTKRFSFTTTISKDFTTTATDSSVDTLSANLNAQYVLNSRWNIFGGVGAGESAFLNGVDPGRLDNHLSWNAGIGYSLNEHFKASLAYSHFLNWSNRTGANFERDTITLSLSTRW